MDKKDVDNTGENLGVPPELVRFFYLSYFYSQGNAGLQKHIFDFAVSINAFKKIPKEPPEALLAKLKPPKSHGLEGDYSDGFRREWHSMFRSFSKESGYAPRPIRHLALEMVKTEGRYVRGEIRRRSRKIVSTQDLVVPDSNEDTHASFVRRYGMLGESTNDPVLDRMFLEIKRELTKEGTFLHRHLLDLSEDWEKQHPGHNFFPEPVRET